MSYSEGKGGRPTIFTEELADTICKRISEGNSLRTVCADEEMPVRQTIYNWFASNERFLDQYMRAREEQADYFAEEMIDIADNANNDYMERLDKDDQSIGWRENGEYVRRSQIRIETRKWLMARMAPKKYGDVKQIELGGKDGGPIKTEEVSTMETARQVAFLLASAAQEKT